ncbi:YhdP family protein [Candidatus Photodesmus blepharus]|uniref:YhdP family protein n=1 Tax=Candidatus Photodesmus blepharonis TaxID=1179155 RepID=UPI001F5FE34F|nr:YhdP family protein [Candidatus Photodesmus blepharus]
MTRLLRFVSWLTMAILVFLIVTTLILRVTFFYLNHFQDNVQEWGSQLSNIDLQIQKIKGSWSSAYPSISLQGVTAQLPENAKAYFSTEKVEIKLDLIQSLIQLQPIIANINIHKLRLNARNLTPFKLYEKKIGLKENIVFKFDQFLKRINAFSLLDSTVWYKSYDKKNLQLNIQKLHWKNQGKSHLIEGLIGADKTNNSVLIKANFIDHGSLNDVSGEFYVSADDFLITPWLSSYFQKATGLERGVVSFNSWLTVVHNRPIDAYAEIRPSELIWTKDFQHQFLIKSGVFRLSPTGNGWIVNSHELNIQTDGVFWPKLSIVFDWQPKKWRLNMLQIDMGSILPLVKLAPNSNAISKFLDKFKLVGLLSDIRVSGMGSLSSLRYSAKLTGSVMAQWGFDPEIHNVIAFVSGNTQQAKASVTLTDDSLLYGNIFQSPINLKTRKVDLFWQTNEDGWFIWSDKLIILTPELQILGTFRLDLPKNHSPPFLSFYAEANLDNDKNTWNYLSTLLFKNYFFSEIQAGYVRTAKILWYGKLSNFPYHNRDGIFQISVGVEKARFSFNAAWPPIVNLQLDLLFENDLVYLDSNDASLMDVKVTRIIGVVPFLNKSDYVDIEMSIVASGNEIRDYLLISPLAQTANSAFNVIQISGDIHSTFRINIPFNIKDKIKVWGYADLNNNHINIGMLSTTLESVSGRISFDDNVVKASRLSANLLNQPILFDFLSKKSEGNYQVGIDVLGKFDVKRLKPYIGESWAVPLSGYAPLEIAIDIQLSDFDFTYKVDVVADLKMIKSDYPYPLMKTLNQEGQMHFQFSGNKKSMLVKLELLEVKYQAEMNINLGKLVPTATKLVVGQGKFGVGPVFGHNAEINSDEFNMDKWMMFFSSSLASQSILDLLNISLIPIPQQIKINVSELVLGDVEWHDVSFLAQRKKIDWYFTLTSKEVEGEASYDESRNSLNIFLKKLHLYFLSVEKKFKKESLLIIRQENLPLVRSFERKLHRAIPNVVLVIDDFWLQGHRIGQVDVEIQRKNEKIVEWKKISLTSGNNKVDATGSWVLNKDQNRTNVNLHITGENNSELMERFGINSGVQKASFNLFSQLEWDGPLWSIKLDTLEGEVKSKFGKGIISDVSGGTHLLGFFSLDSIIRKMKLDFSDVFDKGMAFNSIIGTGKIRSGVFVTNDIKMDALAGQMNIKGLVDLKVQTVNAEVNFVPDITSGIPVLTAFAVTPQTTLYVLAITTVIAPVVEVFTQVNYEVKGPLDNPVVKEISRSKGEFKLREVAKKVSYSDEHEIH